MRPLASWLFLALAGCQLVSGIASYDVGGGGAGGAPPDFGPLCDEYCELAKNVDGCPPQRACIEAVCRETLLLDLYPNCHTTAFDYGTCLMKQPPSDFTCDNNLPVPSADECADERARWMDCLVGTTFDTNQEDCTEACNGPFNGLCGAMPAVCRTVCIDNAKSGHKCAGLYAGVARCAAENSTESWMCVDLIITQIAGPGSPDHACYFVYGMLVSCLEPLEQDGP